MAFLDILWSSPLPTIAAVVIAIACAVGYWLFVLPMIEDVKRLRSENSDAAATISEYQKHFLKIQETVDKTQTNLTTVATLVERQTKQIHVLTQHTLHVSQRTKSVEEQVSSLQLIARNSEHALRILSEISDKQSQLSGVIYGLNLRGSSPPRGP